MGKLYRSEQHSTDQQEEGVEVPYKEIKTSTLQRIIQEFVTRDGVDWADPGCTLEDKIEQVMRQLKEKQIKVVFDLKSQTANIVAR